MTTTPTTTPRRRFFSLKWRILIIFSLLLLAINGLSTLYFSRMLLKNFELERKALHSKHIKELDGMVRHVSDRLSAFGDIVPSLNGMEEGLAEGSAIKIAKAFERHWQTLQLGAAVDVAQLYSTDSSLIQSWKSEDIDLADQEQVRNHVREVNRSERPSTFLDCTAGKCTQFAVVPLLAKNKNAGVVVLGSTLAPGVVHFKDVTGVDIGVLNDPGKELRAAEPGPLTIPPWNFHVSALTNLDQNLPLLQSVASQKASLARVAAGVRETFKGHDFEIKLLPIGRLSIDVHGNANFILIDDVTRDMTQIRDNIWRNIAFGVSGLLLSEAILLLFLWAPLSRLRRTALALPLLARNAFEQARQAVKNRPRKRWFVDEFDLLDDTLVSASFQLEQLREVTLHTNELELANIRLEDASRMKSQFLANMSHELRTPLNAIIGFSEILKDGLMGELTDQQREYIGDIFTSGQHLLSLINDILDLSKVEAGKMTLDLEPVEGRSLFTNSLSIVKEKAAAHRIRMKLEADELGVLLVDPRKVKQIVYNLLSNAVKFTTDGSQVILRARRVPSAAVGKLSGNRPGRCFPLPNNTFTEFLEIGVTDGGIGISGTEMQKLFNPFSQLDNGLARKFEGTGLGLALVRLLTELHGGTVAVESALGEGSCFTVWLPLRPVGEAACASLGCPPPPSVAQPEGERVALVVEDDDRAAELIRMQLNAEGLTVLRASNAEDALEIALRQELTLITLDILLPGIDGWEFLARLKQSPMLSHIPVVVVSIVADINKGISLDASAVLQKPISREELRAALANLDLPPPSPNRELTVLVADDDPISVEIIAAHLQAPDYAVSRVYGGREAIETARRLRPDLIVLDLMMPEVSGFDVVEALSGDPDTASIPILIVTAKQVTNEERAMLNRYVTRIVDKAKLKHSRFLNEVRRALASHLKHPDKD